MFRAVAAAFPGTVRGFNSTKLPKTTIANVSRPLQPATFAAVRCELSILLVVISFLQSQSLRVVVLRPRSTARRTLVPQLPESSRGLQYPARTPAVKE